jgi:transcriptional regulator with XRE-family HTH domain
LNLTTDRPAAPPHGVRIDARALRHAMSVRALTGNELARRARVSNATISHAMNGRRIRPATLRAINAVLRATPPLEDVEALLARDDGGLPAAAGGRPA